MSIFDSVLNAFDIGADFIGDAFGGLGDFAGDAFDGAYDFLTSFGDVDFGDIASLAGNLLLEGVNYYSVDRAVDAALKAGDSAADVFLANADLLYGEADRLEGRTARDIALAEFQGIKLLAQQQSAYLKSGVTLEGSPLLVMDETRMLVELQVEQIGEAGRSAAENLRARAQIEEKKAANAIDAAGFEAENTALQAAANAVNRYI